MTLLYYWSDRKRSDVPRSQRITRQAVARCAIDRPPLAPGRVAPTDAYQAGTNRISTGPRCALGKSREGLTSCHGLAIVAPFDKRSQYLLREPQESHCKVDARAEDSRSLDAKSTTSSVRSMAA